ncbi:hypothetical protein H0X48_04600 [Candidatus Dependentiae bacterium]|nr:hypothetical protein [Candidatus Dependentiae bacterium]
MYKSTKAYIALALFSLALPQAQLSGMQSNSNSAVSHNALKKRYDFLESEAQKNSDQVMSLIVTKQSLKQAQALGAKSATDQKLNKINEEIAQQLSTGKRILENLDYTAETLKKTPVTINDQLQERRAQWIARQPLQSDSFEDLFKASDAQHSAAVSTIGHDLRAVGNDLKAIQSKVIEQQQQANTRRQELLQQSRQDLDSLHALIATPARIQPQSSVLNVQAAAQRALPQINSIDVVEPLRNVLSEAQQQLQAAPSEIQPNLPLVRAGRLLADEADDEDNNGLLALQKIQYLGNYIKDTVNEHRYITAGVAVGVGAGALYAFNKPVREKCNKTARQAKDKVKATWQELQETKVTAKGAAGLLSLAAIIAFTNAHRDVVATSTASAYNYVTNNKKASLATLATGAALAGLLRYAFYRKDLVDATRAKHKLIQTTMAKFIDSLTLPQWAYSGIDKVITRAYYTPEILKANTDLWSALSEDQKALINQLNN